VSALARKAIPAALVAVLIATLSAGCDDQVKTAPAPRGSAGPHAVAGSRRGPDATAARGGTRVTLDSARRTARYPVYALSATDADAEAGLADVLAFVSPSGSQYYIYYESGLEISIVPTKFPLDAKEFLTDEYPMDSPEGSVVRTRYVETTVRGSQAFAGDAFTQTLSAGEVNYVPAVLTWSEMTADGTYVIYTILAPSGSAKRLQSMADRMQD